MQQIQADVRAVRPLRTLELFAGVGGFRVGLNATQAGHGAGFEVVWANQFEPSMKKQWAAEVYRARWGNSDLVNEDLFKVLDDDAAMARIDALDPEVLVGGFPCQDYSVAQPSSRSQGLSGKKGVLWWGIHRLLSHRICAGRPVKYVMLENVDRLISSPSNCKGRDFAIILASLQELGYAVEWRVVNAADYGHAQKRRRIFIQAYHQSTALHIRLAATVGTDAMGWLTQHGPMAQALPARLKAGAPLHQFELPTDTYTAQQAYTADKGRSSFASGGVCVNGQVWSAALEAPEFADYTGFVGQAEPLTLGDIVRDTTDVPASFFLDEDALPRWQATKGAKSIERVNADGHAYTFSEGSIAFPDPLDRPARTVITSEGGMSPSRTIHVVEHTDGRLRRLTPEELEALNGFTRGFTDIAGIKPAKRAFLMGNALVTGIVTRLGQALIDAHVGTTDAAPTETTTPARVDRTGEMGDERVSAALLLAAAGSTIERLGGRAAGLQVPLIIHAGTHDHDLRRRGIEQSAYLPSVGLKQTDEGLDASHCRGIASRRFIKALLTDAGVEQEVFIGSGRLLKNGMDAILCSPVRQGGHDFGLAQVIDDEPIDIAHAHGLVVEVERQRHHRVLRPKNAVLLVFDKPGARQGAERLLGQAGAQGEARLRQTVRAQAHVRGEQVSALHQCEGEGGVQRGAGLAGGVKHANLLIFRESALRHCNADHTPQARGPTARHASRHLLELGLIGCQLPGKPGVFGYGVDGGTLALTRQVRITHRGAHLGVTERAHHVIKFVRTVDEQARERVPQVMHPHLWQAGFFACSVPGIEDGHEGAAGLGAGEDPLGTGLAFAPWHRSQQGDQGIREMYGSRLARFRVRHEPGLSRKVDIFPACIEHLALAHAGQQEHRDDEAQEFVGAGLDRFLQTGHFFGAEETLADVLRVDQLDHVCRVGRHPGHAPLDGEIEEVAHQDDAPIGRPARRTAREVLAVKALHVLLGDFGQSPRAQCGQQMVT